MVNKIELRYLEKGVIDALWDVRHLLGVLKATIHDFERVEEDLIKLRDAIQKFMEEEADGQ